MKLENRDKTKVKKKGGKGRAIKKSNIKNGEKKYKLK
jgi:hypothetical protein